jgi:hypothetical protein
MPILGTYIPEFLLPGVISLVLPRSLRCLLRVLIALFGPEHNNGSFLKSVIYFPLLSRGCGSYREAFTSRSWGNKKKQGWPENRGHGRVGTMQRLPPLSIQQNPMSYCVYGCAEDDEEQEQEDKALSGLLDALSWPSRPGSLLDSAGRRPVLCGLALIREFWVCLPRKSCELAMAESCQAHPQSELDVFSSVGEQRSGLGFIALLLL